MHRAFKATILEAPKGALKDLATVSLSQTAAKAACFFMPSVSCQTWDSYPDQKDRDTP